MEFVDYLGSWFFRHDPNFDIVTIHGLLQSGKSPFQDDGSRTKWLNESLVKDTDARLMAFSYRNIIEQGRIHTRVGLQTAAQSLLDSLFKHRSETSEIVRPLAFVSHDMGGIVLKNAMVLAAQNQEKYGDILRETYAMVFLSCPHRVSDGDSFMDQIIRWIHNEEHLTKDGLLNTARLWLSSILEINGLFLECGMILRSHIVNVFSEHRELNEQVFPPFTATLGTPGELRLSSRQSCATLLCSDEENTVVEQAKKVLTVQKKGGRLSTKALQGLHGQLSLTPPVHPGQEEPNESALEWLFTNQKFVRWIYRSGSRFLHLVQAASETKSPSSLFRLLKDVGSQSIRESHIFYFQFRKHDARFNCIRGLLTTFIAQATATMVPNITLDESASQMLENVGFMKPLPDHDLFYLVACVCRAIRTRNGQVYWIIWNLDACSDSLSRLVKSLADLDTFSEFPCRILFESSGAQGVIESMNDLEVVTVKNEGASPTPNNKHVSSPELEKLTKDCPALSPFSDSLNKVLSHHRQNNIVDTVIAQWTFNFTTALAACSSPKTINEALERLSNMTAQQFFMNIIASIPPHKFPWAKRVLAWVKNSCRPLTIWELDNAMGFNKTAPRHADHWRTTDFAFDLQDCFLGLLIVENNEVSFIHPTVREYLSHPECASQNWHMADRDAHLDMLQSLLRCLCREDDRVLSPPAPVKRGYLSHPVPSRLDLRSYAAEYWLQHYREAKHRAQKPSEYEGDIKVFLGNPAAVRSWASIMGLEQPLEAPEGHNSGGAPFSQLAVVTLAARVGLGTAEFDFLCPGWQSHPELVLAALLEGVSNGHISLVKQLEMPPLDEKSLDELIDMASSCGDAEVFRILFSKIRGRSKFPPQFLKRAARLGVEQVIKQVIGDGNSGEDAGEESLFNYISDLIIEAIRFRQTEITKFLVKRLAPQNPTFDMLKTACQVGNSCDLEQLLEDGFNTAALRKSGRWDRSDFKDLLETACTCGNPAVVEVLIRDSNADEMGNLWPCLELAVSNGLPECTAKLLTLIELSSESPSSVRDHLWDVLMAGVGEGQVDTCRLLLDKGVDPNYKKSHNNDAALCHAFKKGKIPMIALLLDRGMDIEGTDDYDATALWEAANRGLTEIVTYLLDRGADVNTRAGYGGTALYQACLKNHKAIVEILLQKGANVRLSTHRKNWSPLEASFDFPDILELLVEKSPDFRRVAGGTTALWRAARGGFEKSAELLLRGDPNIEFIPMDYSEEEDGLTPLAMAVKGGHAKVARLLLEAGANINYVTPKGDFILKFVQNGETLAVLLEYNPDLKLVDEEGNAAIHVLVSQSTEDLAAIKRLVNAGADIQAFNKVGETPLTIAVAGGDMELITYLVSKAAGIDTSKAYSGGALHQACNVASLKIVKFLVDNGANVDLPHTAVGTPLSCVCTSEKEQFDKITYLVEERHAKIGVKGGWHGHALNEACLRCDVNTVRYLVNQGGKTFLSQPDHLGRVPVFYACYKREDAVNMVRYLISQGVDVSAKVKDKMGRTVLHCAVVAHNPDLVRLLIEHDKELVHAADDDGWTPLHWATRRAYGPVSNSGMWYTRPSTGEKLSDMVRLLLKDGSGDLVLTGKAANQRWSPLKLARYHGVYESLKDQLTPESLKEEQPAENPELYESKAAVFHRRLCDACFCELRGVYYRCTNASCFDYFDLCFKCIDYRKVAHDPDHEFRKILPEFEDENNENSASSPQHVGGGREVSVGPVEMDGDANNRYRSWNDDDINVEDL